MEVVVVVAIANYVSSKASESIGCNASRPTGWPVNLVQSTKLAARLFDAISSLPLRWVAHFGFGLFVSLSGARKQTAANLLADASVSNNNIGSGSDKFSVLVVGKLAGYTKNI